MSDGSIERAGPPLFQRFRAGDHLGVGDLRVLGLYLGVATMQASDGLAYKLLDGTVISQPGRRTSRASEAKLRSAIQARADELDGVGGSL